MIVTFVSQCQKKALNRTRRVLDAFANRIGDNTWQTVITEDGLIAVKKLLRKTASKNTAVSCHWVRSRARSELVWVVGNRSQFNHSGIVPVNTTSKELIMDIVIRKAEPNTLYANTHLQRLDEHLFAVAYVAERLHQHLLPKQNLQSTATFVAGCLHDLGKIDPCFQEWVKNPKKKYFVADDGQHIDDKKFSFDNHPRHNEISVLLYHFLDNNTLKQINVGHKKAIKHAVYWHHAKPFRKAEGFATYGEIYKKFTNNLKDIGFSQVLKNAISLLKNVENIDKEYRATEETVITKAYSEAYDLEVIAEQGELPLPSYKKYELEENPQNYTSQIKHNADNNIVRSCLITADRWVSAFSSTDLQQHIKNKTLEGFITEQLLVESSLCSQIETCLTQFPVGERTNKQSEKAHELVKAESVAVLAGAAGCGKTKIALEWAKLKNAQQIVWICPRVQICQGLFHELISEQYLPNSTIEINTGEFKFTNQWDKPTAEVDYFSGDIVITTIDQIFSAIITHTKANSLINFLNAHIVFDEYHEYINMPAFNLLFAELIACKQKQEKQANTLLVSATPPYFYLRQILEIDRDDIVEMPSFNLSDYRIEFKVFDEAKQVENPLYHTHQSKTFVISNTAVTAQKSFIKNQHQENAVLLHSKFKKSDKKLWFDEVYESFKKQGTNKFTILRSGPIVQASLNISCDYMVSEMTSPENMLQRLGRLDRFGENHKTTNVLTIAITDDVINGKSKGNSSRFLNNLHSLQTSKAWYECLQDKLNGKIFRLPELYCLYKNFYEQNTKAKEAVASDLMGALKKSVQLISEKVIDPITVPPKNIQNKAGAKISKHSLRGDNRFVQMAVYDLNNPDQPIFLEQYAYQPPISERDEFDNLTASTEEIQGYGDSNKNLLAYMKSKHHNIIGGTPAHKDFILLNEARDPEFPVYLSYTPNGLDKVGGESARHSHAIYYAVCDKQPIGAISMQQLTSIKD
ncbi:MAG: CRISPR-associated endonuclease Cas3'' [Methylotenera sp.]|nr:CRISPR-associated endonuclease Cas3'' [Methylotenera sp.]